MSDVGWGNAGPAPVPLYRYFTGVVITVVAIFSQYFVPQEFPATNVLYGNLPGDLLIVYVVPVVAFALLVGWAPLRNWRQRMGLATWHGLRFYGLLTLLGLVVAVILIIVYDFVDPSALKLLQRPNPVLQQAQGNPWFFVGFSFVVGAFEETIFRGYFFGFWRDRPGPWIVPAVWTSIVFAVVHLYYATTYGIAAPLLFPGLFLLGLAFAATYKYSGGNLVVPAALHGAHDAAVFLTLISPAVGAVALYGLVLLGALIGLIEYLRNGSRPAPIAGPPPGAF